MTDAPERIYHWLDSQLSIARHYGGCWYNDHEYRGEAMCAALLASVPQRRVRQVAQFIKEQMECS